MHFVITNENGYPSCKGYTSCNFQLKTGFNILNGCEIPFADIKNIHELYYNGYWIRPVIVPRDAKIIKDYNYWRTDKIIMGDRFPLYDLKTIKKFNLNITDVYISEVCKRGKVNILEWWKNSGLELKYDEWVLNFAFRNNHVEVLKWWKNSGLELKYDHDEVLEWCKNSVLLEWIKNFGFLDLELKYNGLSLDEAYDNGLSLNEVSENALDFASQNGHVELLEWWKISGLEELKYTENALDWASAYGHVELLEWWKNSGLELKYTEIALNLALQNGQVKVLEWWKNSGLELKYDETDDVLIWYLEIKSD
jgi:hypothetical protein